MKSPRFIVQSINDPWGMRAVLIDTQTNEEVGYDSGEPEDNTFGRDWAWVPVLLNKFADEVEQLKGQKY